MNEPTVPTVDRVSNEATMDEHECCDVYAEYCYPCAEGEHDPREHVEGEIEHD